MIVSRKLEITTPDGVAAAWAYHPEGAAPAPAVLFFADAGGVRPAMQQMAERVASMGYFVLLPNIFYRSGDFKPFDFKSVFSDPSERARLMAIIGQVDDAAIARDTAAYLDAVGREPQALAGKVGCMGYCFGGRMAFLTACTHPDRIGAAASIHGGWLVKDEPNSPHAQAGRIKGQIYIGVADDDASCTPEHQGALASSLAAAHVAYQIELYPGARHGFAALDAPIYDAAAAERHWERLESLFKSALPRKAA